MRRIISAAAIALAVVACTDTPLAVETDLEPQFDQVLPCITVTSGSGVSFDCAGDGFEPPPRVIVDGKLVTRRPDCCGS